MTMIHTAKVKVRSRRTRAAKMTLIGKKEDEIGEGEDLVAAIPVVSAVHITRKVMEVTASLIHQTETVNTLILRTVTTAKITALIKVMRLKAASLILPTRTQQEARVNLRRTLIKK